MNHRARAEKMSHAWVAVCEDCAFLGGDHDTEAPAKRDAEIHERGELHPWQLPTGTEWQPPTANVSRTP